MSRLGRLIAGSRLAGELSFLFDGALIWGVASAVVAVAVPAPAMLAGLSRPARLFFQAGIGFGLGWWCGLPWTFAFALTARAYRPPPAVATLVRITWVAVAVFAALALVPYLAGLPLAGSVGAGVIAATLAARVGVATAARRSQA
ncbi:MAG TPA: hypothetical protein VLW17_03400 [Thermoanaerobaculaceae bacterium]|nr:hypothetical protein [Thermoanaerobaculaceae bacterium]